MPFACGLTPRPWCGEVTAIAPLIGGEPSSSASCDIKGNISVNRGERIYHVPGQKFYDRMVISEGKGERWFCSEDDALAAGWRTVDLGPRTLRVETAAVLLAAVRHVVG